MRHRVGLVQLLRPRNGHCPRGNVRRCAPASAGARDGARHDGHPGVRVPMYLPHRLRVGAVRSGHSQGVRAAKRRQGRVSA